MKPILFATDYSEAAKNAGDHAARLSKLTDSELIIFHSWSLPVMSGETLTLPTTLTEIEKLQIEAIEKEAARLQTMWGVRTRTIQHAGFAIDEITATVKENRVGLIVMGMQHPNAAGKLFGSVTTAFMKHAEVPVLVIPEKSNFRKPRAFLLATDLHTHSHWHELDSLKELAERFHSNVHIINVSRDLELTKREDGKAGIMLDNYMKDFPHTWHFGDGTDVAKIVQEKSEEIEADLIAVIHHHLPWYKEVFHHSITRELSFSTTKPLLILPEKITHLK